MFQGQNAEIIVKLLESTYEHTYEGLHVDIPASGILYTDLTLKYWKTGDTAFSTHPLTAADWTELEDGLYILRLPGELLDTLGTFFFQLGGLMTQNYERELFIVPAPISLVSAPNTCVVSGNVVDITGDPDSCVEISFRVAQLPRSVSGAMLNSSRIRTIPDAYGNFSVRLVQGSEVVVEIQKAGINNKFTVPEQATANLLDLLPPF